MSNAHHSFNVEDAKKYGVECAVLLYNIRFWLDKNKANNKHIHDGRVWTYNSTKAFSDLFPYLTQKQIYRRLNKLEEKEVLITGNFNTNKYDRTKWYSINEPEYSISEKQKNHFPESENGNSESRKPIPDDNTDKKPDSATPPEYEIPTQDQVEAYFREDGNMLKEDIPLEAEKFINHYEEREWCTSGGSGKRIKNWHLQAGTWIANYKQWNKEKLDSQQRQPEYMQEL